MAAVVSGAVVGGTAGVVSRLDPELIEGFVDKYLRRGFDRSMAVPGFHRELWGECCSEAAHVAVAAPRGHGKAQPLTARVLTPNGWRLMGELAVGDLVVGSGGGFTSVLEVHPASLMATYRVKTVDGRVALCSEEHLWPVVVPSNTKNKRLVKSLRELMGIYASPRFDKRSGKELTEYRCFVPMTEAVDFEWKDLPLDPYVFGVWLGDGTSSSSGVTSADPEIFDGFNFRVGKVSAKYRYTVYGLSPILRKMGVLNRKHVPPEYLLGSSQQRLDLLRGLMDTDGDIHRDGKIAYFSNTNARLIDAVIEIVRSLGGIARINERQTWCNGKSFDSWRVSVRLPKKLCPFRLKRKADKWVGSERSGEIRTPIVSIERVEDQVCRCITVGAEDGIYITDDWLPTHNSTAVTHSYTLAEALFGGANYILIVSDTEKQSLQFLGDIKSELQGNEGIVRDFGIKSFFKDTESEIVVLTASGAFNITAKGSEQKVRGLKWLGRRPDLIVVDDAENDEAVSSKERREKLRTWFFNALMPCGSDGCRVRMVGTVMHDDSLLNRLLSDKTWRTLRYEAHNEDYSRILWREKFPVERLKAIREKFAAQNDLEGYSMEYLNQPIDAESAYFQKRFIEAMQPMDYRKPKRYYTGMDLAVTKKEKSDYTVITTAGMDELGMLHVVDVRRGRWDAQEIIEEMFSVQEKYEPDIFATEKGVIEKTLLPFLRAEMMKRGVFINLYAHAIIKDKMARAKSIQVKTKSGAMRFDSEAEWYGDLLDELMRFPRGKHDDQVDSLSIIGMTLDDVRPADSAEMIEEEEYTRMVSESGAGRNEVTGY